MQFLGSTYRSYVGFAKRETIRRGFIVRNRLWSYYEPLGQALTAAYMHNIGMAHAHWDPRIDPLCR